jgi:hypothetical protein
MPKEDTIHRPRHEPALDISEMSDEHLINTLNLHLRKIAETGYESAQNRAWVLPPYLDEARERKFPFPTHEPYVTIISRIEAGEIDEDWDERDFIYWRDFQH